MCVSVLSVLWFVWRLEPQFSATFHVMPQPHPLSTVCVRVSAGKGLFKGNANGHVESLGPVSTASYIPLPWNILYDNHLALHSTYRWYVGSGIGRILEKGSTGTRSSTEWCAPAAVTRGAARFYTRTCIIAILKPFSLLMELWDYQKPRRLKSFQIYSTSAFYYHHYVGEFV